MMTLLIGFLTVIMVLNSIFLILLVLIQLPKKEAGVGVAFGGGATETLFGAGSGTVLTKATKYSAALFMSLSLLLAIMNSHVYREDSSSLDEQLRRLASPSSVLPATSPSEPAPNPTLPQPAPSEPTGSTPESAATPTLLLSTSNAVPTAPAVPAPTNPAPQQ